MTDSRPRADHLCPGEIAAFLDRTLTGASRGKVEDHLARCGECREELREVARTLRTGRNRSRWWTVGLPVAAAAAMLGLVVIVPRVEGPDESTVLRQGGTSAQELEAVLPASGASAARDSLSFVWRSAGPGAHYRFTLTRPEGIPLWNASTADTMVPLPDSVPVVPGQSYFWYVEAQLADGGSVVTRARRLTVRP